MSRSTVASIVLTFLASSVLSAQAVPPVKLCTIKGTVEDDPRPDKRVSAPIAGAKVYLKSPLYVLNSGAGPDLIIAPYPLYTIVDSATTDQQGTFTFALLATGSYRLSASKTGFSSRDLDLSLVSDTTVQIQLLTATAAGSLTGTVSVDMGLLDIFVPVPNCTVTAYVGDYQIMPYMADAMAIPIGPIGTTYRGVTDAQGRYTISNIPITQNGESAMVTAAKSGFTAATVDTQLWNGMSTTINFRLATAYANTASKTVKGIVYTVATDKKAYQIGELLKVRYSIQNNSADTFRYYGGACDHNFMVLTKAGKQLFNYLTDRQIVCPLALYLAKLAPGERVDFAFPDSSFRIPAGYDSLRVMAQLQGNDTSAVSVGIRILTTAAGREQLRQGLRSSSVDYVPGSRRLTMKIDKPQMVSVNAYLLNGEQVRQLSARKFMDAGTHSFSLEHMRQKASVVVLKIAGENFAATRKIDLTR